KDVKGDLNDKKVKLEKLKKEKTTVETDIRKLEEEIAKLDPASQGKAKLISVAPVTQQDFTHYIDLQGKVDANDVVVVTPRGAPAQVKQIYIKRGDMVKRGQLLLKLDDAIMLQQLDGLNTQLEYAKNIYNRQKNLWDQGIGTEVQLITAKNNVDGLEKQMATLKENWKTSFVYAPIGGLADVVDIKEGEIFSGMRGSDPQIRIVNSSEMKVVTEIPENYASRVKKGSPVLIIIPDMSNDSIRSTISVIGASINMTSRGFITEARLPSKPGYRINQVALIRIKDYAAPKAITVPINVVQTDETGKYVYVMVKEGNFFKARKKKVEVGETYNGVVEVKVGLISTDQIITEGYQVVYDGQVITTEVK
ncbi:MAG TPA: efflux RND transporter periplasmic adaptor subunit, partial [Chitinophagaceae bacterium]|nr:efflux RND transporter periplasmic adaptor subunit [Chitinophagaceae bacterium]